MDTLNVNSKVPGLNLRKATTGELVGLVILAVLVFSGVWASRFIFVTAEYQEKLEAARLAERAQRVVKQERLARGYSINPKRDPNGTGLIGLEDSIITTSYGQLSEKQTSLNPNMAAVVVELLKEAGVERGDVIAVGQTGSFPALDIAVLSAAEVMQVRPVIITSIGSSNWGANNPDFTWLDIERLLAEKGIFQHRSVAVSLGGQGDAARDLSQEGVEALFKVVQRSGVLLIHEGSVTASIERRMSLYQAQPGGRRPAAYVNIGGGVASVGRNSGLDILNAGLNRPGDVVTNEEDSVASRMAAQGVPVVHLEQVDSLVKRYGLPAQPVPLPSPGSGGIYDNQRFKLVGSIAGATVLVAALFVVRGRLGGSAWFFFKKDFLSI